MKFELILSKSASYVMLLAGGILAITYMAKQTGILPRIVTDARHVASK